MSLPGRLCIFNHQDFESDPHKYRIGSEYDVKTLQKAFGKYGVRSKVFPNFTKERVIKEMIKISKMNFTNKSCLIIAILTHGGLNDTILACGKNHQDEIYSIQNEVVNHITSNPSLRNKPKIIIVQACKNNMPENEKKQHDSLDSFDNKPVILSDVPADSDPRQLYKFYSTAETFYSYRKTCGSIFIKTFCRMLDEYGETENIENIMDRTSLSVAVNNLNLLEDNAVQYPSKCVTVGHPPFIFGKYATIE